MDRKQLPDKLYFKIGEVAKIVGVKPYVLRYWETEFSALHPGKTRSRHRLYRRRDVDLLLEIKRLLHGERYTIEGAKKRLRELLRTDRAPDPQRAALARVRNELVELYALVSQRPSPGQAEVGVSRPGK